MIKKIIRSIGPIILSAFSIIITFLIIQPLALFLDPNFNLLSSRDIGKIAFMVLVIFQIILFLTTLSSKFMKNFWQTNVYFFKEKDFLKKFFSYFMLFFSLHALLLYIFYLSGFTIFNEFWGKLTLGIAFKVLFGFVATFFLAWTEELIFRGTLFPYFEQTFSTFSSMLLTSLIFMFVHDLRNPLNLITKNWQLGLGLFLLGVLLNLIFINTKKLYTNMGAHAGIVFVKVFLRKIPFIIFLSSDALPAYINFDLRKSYVVHFLFLFAIIIFIFKNKKQLFN